MRVEANSAELEEELFADTSKFTVGANSAELEEQLFADTSDALQEAFDHTISSHTVVTVECKQKRATNVLILWPFW